MTMNPPSSTPARLPGSFRDPNGFVFRQDGIIYRQINAGYATHYEFLLASGLYDHLTGKGWLIPHTEADMRLAQGDDAYKVIRPEPAPFIAYPYEWAFGQLQDAALLTLKIQRAALKRGMILKDASAYNIQFVGGKPALIDTLSFEKYVEGQSWIAYRQFCQHFLAPLLLAHYKDIRLAGLSRLYIDGIPLDLAATLLPKRSWLKLGVTLHLHLHSRAQRRYADQSPDHHPKKRQLSAKSLENINSDLLNMVEKLHWRPNTTEWAEYYQGDSYDSVGAEHKQTLVGQYIEQVAPRVVWDLGANTGLYSRLASARGIDTIAWDIDPGAVELNYRQVKANQEEHLLPLVLDLANPSPAIGWENTERASLFERSNADLVLALALVHHLAIGNNVPLVSIARLLSRLAEWLIIEFVPKEDPKVQKLLASRVDIFPAYTQAGFEQAFATAFTIEQSAPIQNSSRRLYLMKRL